MKIKNVKDFEMLSAKCEVARVEANKHQVPDFTYIEEHQIGAYCARCNQAFSVLPEKVSISPEIAKLLMKKLYSFNTQMAEIEQRHNKARRILSHRQSYETIWGGKAFMERDHDRR